MRSTFNNEQIARQLYGYRNIHRPLQSPADFDEAALEHYRQYGFVAIENVFSPGEVNAAKEALRGLIMSDDPALAPLVSYEPDFDVTRMPSCDRINYVRKLMGFVGCQPHLAAMTRQSTLLSIAERLVGEEVRLTQDMALVKQAYVGTEKPWHQDTAYFLLEPRDKIIGTWTALDEATPENGCMHVIPGSHRDGPRPHYHDRDCQLPDDPDRVQHDVVVPLHPGGVLFFSGLLHHGTPPNQSPASRWALQYHYASVNCRPIDVVAHGEGFHDAEGYAGCASWAISTPLRPMPTR